MPEIGGVSLFIAFAAGLLSCLSPCSLPMVPTYVGYLGGATATASADRYRLTLLRHAGAFMAGFATVFILFGASVGFIGWVLRDNIDFLQKGAGILMIVFGLHISGVLQIPGFDRETRLDCNPVGRVGYVRSALVGSAYAIGWTPCIGPTLGAILTLAAASGTVWQGTALLGVYSLGMAVPFLAIALAFTSVQGFYRRLGPYLGAISFASGVLLIIVGILVYTGSLVNLNQYFGVGAGGLSGNL